MVRAPSPPKSQPSEGPCQYTAKSPAFFVKSVPLLRCRLGRGRLSTETEKDDKAGNSEYAAHCRGSPDPLAPELREPVRALWQDRGAIDPGLPVLPHDPDPRPGALPAGV